MSSSNILSAQYILVYDGSSLGNPGPGGFAYALWKTNHNHINITAKANTNTTNTIMELSSIIDSIKNMMSCP